jgi:hypothetical protein
LPVEEIFALAIASTGEYYTYPSTLLRTGDAVGNRLSLTTTVGVW